MSANGNGGFYAPLKQILSDSESEDEHKLENAVHIKATDSCNNLDFNSGLQSSKNYSISDMDEFNTNVNTVESTMDNVSFLQSDISNKMSFPRRCAFIASILMCVFTVVIFLWGIPCSEVGSCAANEWQDRTTSWELPYNEMELSGAVQVVDGAIPNTKNLIFIYRGNHMRQVPKSSSDNVNGVVLIVGNSGKVGWFTRESRIPTEINCHLIDVNRDKQNDCLVSGTEGLLAALDSVSGTYYWHIHKQGKVVSNIAAIDFPIIIKDMNDDKVNELLAVATVYPNAGHKSLIMISGATGNIMTEPKLIDDCLSVKLLSEIDTVNYICKNSTTEAVRHISTSDLKKMLKREQTVNHTPHPPVMMKRVNVSMKKNIGNTIETFTNGPERIVLVLFDKLQTHNVNISQTDIVQICVRGPIESQTPLPLCQPDLDYQEKSLMIADLDGDQSHELISYYSTFVAPEMYSPKSSNPYENWSLTSLVRVIRLESELPKLFITDV